MCGITGIFHLDKDREVNLTTLKNMTNVIKHRGPDGEGYYIKKNMGLGHRRLSIIDLKSGDQPMYNEERDTVVVFNGEVYNYIELRIELENLGYKFKTSSDTEVILKAYEEWGIECQNKFNGMWAFAIWDLKNEQLILSRDRVGEKPLHYSLINNTLVFSSEMKSLFEYGVPKNIRTELIEVYLVLTNIPSPDTFYKNIYKLKPGHYILANYSGLRELKYWSLPEIDESDMLKNKSDIYNEFERLFKDSVKIRMRSDVPYGAFLSGGLDSSCVVSLMSKNSDHPIETFTIGFPQKEFDESNLAQLVSQKFHTNHNLGMVNSDSFQEALLRAVYYFDEPFGDSSSIPTWQVSNYASKKVKMVLTGDGGDEVLSGYTSYVGIKFINYYKSLPHIIRANIPKLINIGQRFSGNSLSYKLNRISNILFTANLSYQERFPIKRSYTSFHNIKSLTKNINDIISIEDYVSEILNKIPYRNDFYKHMFINFMCDLPNDYLVKVDRMSMANSLETRAPFLDFRLIEFLVKVDKSVKLEGWKRKSILRNTIGKSLPPPLLKESERGFTIPLRDWFTKDFPFYEENTNNIGKILDRNTIGIIIAQNTSKYHDHGNFIWTLFMLNAYIK
ncbi:MAG: asparagine synthase (glutamine-hydrolyzing) [Ignavibacteria bacterium]